MNNISIEQATSDLNQLIQTTALTHQPVLIEGVQTNAVLIAEADWQAIQETLYLLSVPGMRESIHTGMQTPVEECDEDVVW